MILFIAYNYYSANEAEENITLLLKEQIDEPRESISIQYSSIDISPFQGNIRFEDINIIQPGSIKRANSLSLDLNYWDFLTFNIGGIEYGLKHLSGALLILNEASWVNRRTLAEVSFNDLTIDYTGNMWDAIQSYFTLKPPNHSHVIAVKGAQAAYWKQESSIGTFEADSVYARFTFQANETAAIEKMNSILFKNISWSPPKEFQQQYSFFIQGFGLDMDSVSFDEAGFSYVMNDERIKVTDGSIEMKLFTALFYGSVDREPILAFTPLYVSIIKLSPELKNVLANLKKLFNLPIPLDDSELYFLLKGPVAEPRIVFDE